MIPTPAPSPPLTDRLIDAPIARWFAGITIDDASDGLNHDRRYLMPTLLTRLASGSGLLSSPSCLVAICMHDARVARSAAVALATTRSLMQVVSVLNRLPLSN